MSYELIITEKPNAAKKIASALADGKPIPEKTGGVTYYKVTHGKRDIIVGCAVGHLYGLSEKKSKGWTYPVFDVVWKPASDIGKNSAHTKRYLTVLKRLAKDADEFTVATDFDIEGEVIGHNILVYACKQKDGNRMKFSTLTAPDLQKAYDEKLHHIDWGQANAGLTRHVLDWYYGINLSRALTAAVKKTGSFKLLSAGRVQGPALKIIVDKEREISAFVPVPYWQLQLKGAAHGEEIIAMHEKDKFQDKRECDAILSKVQGKPASVTKVSRKRFQHAQPFPFDLTSLQLEAYKSLRIPPKETLRIAQDLYTSGLISYPRTSSQQLPPEIDIKKILTDLSRQDFYRGYCETLLKSEMKPNNGKKTDPAHPAIYPTGIISDISEENAKLYDLIVRRFFATMGAPATRETMEVHIDVEQEPFITKGTRTVEKGWHDFYGPHLKLAEETLPEVQECDSIDNPEVEQLAKETQPPKRYTAASIISELEKKNLGTKSTRAQIVDTLFQRGYVHEQSIAATKLGLHMIAILEKYSPLIIDEELTRIYEEAMEKIQHGQKDGEKVLNKAKSVILEILEGFKAKEKELGEELLKATRDSQSEINFIGMCPSCGDRLTIKRGKFGMFVGCEKYPDCKQTYKLPGNALIKSAKKICEKCGAPMVLVIKRRKRPQQMCLNPDCESKKAENGGENEDELAQKAIEKACPKCGGELVIRKSMYGKFIGCSKYPKCKHTEKIGS